MPGRTLNTQQVAGDVWAYAGTRTLTAGAYSVIRGVQLVSGTWTQTSGSTTSKDVTVSSITDYTKCVLLPGSMVSGGIGQGTQLSYYFAVGGAGSLTFTKGPTLTSNTNLRFTIDTNAGTGDVNMQYGVYIVEFV